MGYRFGRTSTANLSECRAPIIQVCQKAIEYTDFCVTCGYRSNEVQAEKYASGRTEPGPIVTYAKPGQSYHNFLPSYAVDLAPYRDHHIPWEDEQAFIELGAVMLYIAWQLGIPLTWGGHWKGRKRDLPHFQIPKREDDQWA